MNFNISRDEKLARFAFTASAALAALFSLPVRAIGSLYD